MSSSRVTSQGSTRGSVSVAASCWAFSSSRSPWYVSAILAPSSAARRAIAQARLRLFATPNTMPVFPSKSIDLPYGVQRTALKVQSSAFRVQSQTCLFAICILCREAVRDIFICVICVICGSRSERVKKKPLLSADDADYIDEKPKNKNQKRRRTLNSEL